MKSKEIQGKTFLVPELEDVLGATDLGTDYVVEDWPWGRKQRCSMHFFVESNKRGERFVKQSTFEGRTNKPKTATYADRVTLIEMDGKVGRVEWSASYQLAKVRMEDGKYPEATFFEDAGQVIADRFFGE